MSRDDDTRTISIGSRTASVAGAIMGVLVLVNMAGSPVGGASAGWIASDTCQTSAFLGGPTCQQVNTAAHFLTGLTHPFQTTTSNTYATSNVNQTESEIVAHGRTVREAQNETTMLVSNQLTGGARNFAWATGKVAAVRALNAGKSPSTARQWADRNVSNYYATIQMNLMGQYQSSASTLNYLQQVNNSQGNMTQWDGVMAVNSSRAFESIEPNRSKATRTIQVTLTNGSTHQYVSISRAGAGSAGVTITPSFATAPNAYDVQPKQLRVNGNSLGVTIRNPLDIGGLESVWSNITKQNNQMTANLDLWVNNTAPKYTAGDINASTLIGPSALASQMDTQFNTTGYYAFAGASLSTLGIPTNMNRSMQITTTVKAKNATGHINTTAATWNGTLYTDWSPTSTHGQWVVGHTYQPGGDPINGTPAKHLAFVATNDGLRQLNNNFTITSMTDTHTGQSVNNTTLASQNQQTANQNISATRKQLQQLINIQKQAFAAQRAAEGASGGGGFLSGLSLGGNNTFIIIVVVGGAAILLLKED